MYLFTLLNNLLFSFPAHTCFADGAPQKHRLQSPEARAWYVQ